MEVRGRRGLNLGVGKMSSSVSVLYDVLHNLGQGAQVNLSMHMCRETLAEMRNSKT